VDPKAVWLLWKRREPYTPARNEFRHLGHPTLSSVSTELSWLLVRMAVFRGSSRSAELEVDGIRPLKFRRQYTHEQGHVSLTSELRPSTSASHAAQVKLGKEERPKAARLTSGYQGNFTHAGTCCQGTQIPGAISQVQVNGTERRTRHVTGHFLQR
jgi:hypothetical protein